MCGELFGVWWYTDFLITDLKGTDKSVLYGGSQASLVFSYDFQFLDSKIENRQRIIDVSGNNLHAYLGSSNEVD